MGKIEKAGVGLAEFVEGKGPKEMIDVVVVIDGPFSADRREQLEVAGLQFTSLPEEKGDDTVGGSVLVRNLEHLSGLPFVTTIGPSRTDHARR